ncbi:MAG: hypothetical protein ISS76_21815 [Phycisphaerae bacterium]|nr:hypothetical protein [Phycisphaerae bacterium]
MAELPRNVREFLVRDLIYIIGGSSVITSFLYLFDRLPNENTPLAFYLLGAGIAYMIGSSLQDLFSILKVVTTGPVEYPNKIIRGIYQRFTGEKWTELKEFDPSKVRTALRSILKNNEARAASYERAISGMILSTTMCPCTLVSSLLIFLKWLASCSSFDLAVALMSFFLSVGMFTLAWLRATQVTRIDAEVLNEYRDNIKNENVSSS